MMMFWRKGPDLVAPDADNDGPLSDDEAALAFLGALFAGSPESQCVEFIAFGPDSLRRWYRRVRELGGAVGTLPRADEVCYFGVLPRRWNWGQRGDLAAATCAWVDWAGQAPEEWPLPPTAVVRKLGRLQAYWRLAETVTDLERIERLNGRLAHLLGGDPSAADRARLLPLPVGIADGRPDHSGGRILRLDARASCSIEDLEEATRAWPVRQRLRWPG